MDNIKKEKLLEYLEKCNGIVSTACRQADVSRSVHYEWLKNDTDYKEKVDRIQEVVIDFVESAFFKKIKDGDTACTIFFLKTRGRKRGYAEKEEHDREVVFVLKENGDNDSD